MSTIPHSYVLMVLLAPHAAEHPVGAVARQWRRMLGPYRPELHYMRGPGPKWRERHAPNITR